MSLQDCTLLFVEDNHEIQEQIKEIFTDEIKTLYQAYDGKEGLEIYREKKPDIVLTDINMPLLNGLEMSREIKKIDKYQPIFMISAYDDKEILLDALNMGIDGFIVKPILDIDTLLDKLNKVAERIKPKPKIELEKISNLEKKEQLYNLHTLAYYDTLTKIPNRFFFEKKLEDAILKAEKKHSEIQFLFIDLDNFKSINDKYGHKIGDKVLISFVQHVQEIIAKEDTFGRIGGDEFALFLEKEYDRMSLELLSLKIIQAAANSLVLDNNSINLSCSIGISRYPQDTTQEEELVHYADLAMYTVKGRGKSDYAFYQKDENREF